MDSDLLLVVGVVLAGLSIPSIMSAFSDDRRPRTSAIMAVLAGGLIVYAVLTHPGGYSLQDIPDVFVRVAAKYIL